MYSFVTVSLLFQEIQPDFELSFENSPSTETLDYVLLDGFIEDLTEVNKPIDHPANKCSIKL